MTLGYAGNHLALRAPIRRGKWGILGGSRAVRYTPLPIAIGMRGAASIPAPRASIKKMVKERSLTQSARRESVKR
jgi:hypothetical protein